MAEETTGSGAAATVHVDDRALLDDLTVLAQPASAAPEAGESRQSQDSERGGGITELAAIQQGTPTLAAQFVPATPDTGAARDASDTGRNPGYGPGNAIGAIDAARPVGPDGSHPADSGTASAPITAVALAATTVQSTPAGATDAAVVTPPTVPVGPVTTAAPTAPPAEAHTAAAVIEAAPATTAPVQPTLQTASVGTPTIAAEISGSSTPQVDLKMSPSGAAIR